MQQFDVKIESRTAGADNTPLLLSNTIFTGGKNRVASQNISKICVNAGCDRVTNKRRKCDSCNGKERYANRTNICLAPSCQQKCVGKWCSRHRTRLRLYGTFDGMPPSWGKGETPEERFWSRVNKDGPMHPYDWTLGRCWEWTGCLMDNGYGTVHFKGRNMLTHRLAWLLVTGSEATNLNLHSCDNRKCVNDTHLREGSYQDNSDDKIARNRMPRGSERPEAVIDESIARQVKNLLKDGLTRKQVATVLNIASGIVAGIQGGRTWNHVEV